MSGDSKYQRNREVPGEWDFFIWRGTLEKIVKCFKYPSIKLVYIFFELAFYWVVFLAFAIVVINTGIKFSWHGLLMFRVCAVAVNKACLFVIGPITVIFAVNSLIRQAKNSVSSGNLGRVVLERQIIGSRMVDVAVIHLDRSTGIKELKCMSNLKGARYFIKEFKQSLELILSDEKFAHCEWIEAISPKVDKLGNIGVSVDRYKSIGVSIMSFMLNTYWTKKLSFYLPVRQYRFIITKEQLKGIDFNKLERMGK